MEPSDTNIYQNFVRALEVYHHYWKISGFSNVDHAKDAESTARFKPFVNVQHYVETYKLLIQATRLIIQMGSRSNEALNENTLELDAALRQTVQTVEHQMVSPQAEKDKNLK